MKGETIRYSGSPDGKVITKLPLTRGQIIAMREAEKCGEELADNFPEMAGLYRDGITARELEKQYKEEINAIAKESKFSRHYAIMYALSKLIPSYEKRGSH